MANSSEVSVLPDCCQGAHKQSTDSFTFAIANNSQKTLHYMIDKLDKTNFSVNSGRIAAGISSSYVLSLRMQQEDSTVYPTTYIAYFYSRPVPNLRWKIHIIIEPAESPSKKVGPVSLLHIMQDTVIYIYIYIIMYVYICVCIYTWSILMYSYSDVLDTPPINYAGRRRKVVGESSIQVSVCRGGDPFGIGRRQQHIWWWMLGNHCYHFRYSMLNF